ncbi:MAG: hemin ABC transporter substrate-binding protein [Pseudomonadales bacterium]|nr:hemin ABC transporter substrate-binding protein [Pseudomonadales bacterium]
MIFSLPASAAPERVVAISGAVTEIVYALNAEDRLVGSDTTSYYPPEAETLPKVGYMRTLSAEGILSLAPDLVILTTEAGPSAAIAQLRQAGTELLIVQDDHRIEGVIQKIERISQALDIPARGAALAADLLRQTEALRTAVAASPARPRVMFILQYSGGAPMVAGLDTAADGIIRLSGADNVVTEYSAYKTFTPEAAIAAAPDILLLTTQGLEQAGGREAVLDMPGLALTPAGKNRRIIALDSLLMLGFGPRTVAAAWQLFQAYHEHE